MITHLLKRLEIGLLLVSEKGKNVEEALEPVPFDRREAGKPISGNVNRLSPSSTSATEIITPAVSTRSSW
jgi:hypothetical protein